MHYKSGFVIPQGTTSMSVSTDVHVSRFPEVIDTTEMCTSIYYKFGFEVPWGISYVMFTGMFNLCMCIVKLHGYEIPCWNLFYSNVH